jgi:hypothetical protein
MNLNDTLWHLERVANSGILGLPEEVALKQASTLLHDLTKVCQMPQRTAEEMKDFYTAVDALVREACKL